MLWRAVCLPEFDCPVANQKSSLLVTAHDCVAAIWGKIRERRARTSPQASTMKVSARCFRTQLQNPRVNSLFFPSLEVKMDLHRKRKLVDCESNVEAKRPHIEDKTPTRSYARARREEDQLYSSKQERPTVKLPEAVYFRAITLMSVLVAVLNLSQNLFFVASDIFYR